MAIYFGPAQPFNARGAYSAIATYNTNDLVEYGGSEYRCLQNATIGHTPATLTAWWELFLAAGAAGAAGAVGPAPTGSADDVVYLSASAVAAARTTALQLAVAPAANMAALGAPWTTAIAPTPTTTTDATLTTLLTVAIPTAKGLALDVLVMGTKRDRTVSECIRILASFANVTGTAALLGVVPALGPTGSTLGTVSVDVDGGANGRVRITGVAATTTDWSVAGVTLTSGVP